MQHSSLLSCVVTELGGAPLGMNSQGIASETWDAAQLANQISQYCSRVMSTLKSVNSGLLCSGFL